MHGGFKRIDQILADNDRIVLQDGSTMPVVGRRVAWSPETCERYAQGASNCYIYSGNAALELQTAGSWITYNLEVDDLHTYIAGGVRVHNDSTPTLAIAADQFESVFGRSFDGSLSDVGVMMGAIVDGRITAYGDYVGALGDDRYTATFYDAVQNKIVLSADAFGLTTATVQNGALDHATQYDNDGIFAGEVRSFSHAEQWFTNHDFSAVNSFGFDAGGATSLALDIERTAFHGTTESGGSPALFSYLPQFGPGYDFNAGTFDVGSDGMTFIGGGGDFGGDFGFLGDFDGGFDLGGFDPWSFDFGFDPIVLDWNGDGEINIRPRFDSTAYFDIDNDGFRERTAWVGPGDAFLVIDLGWGNVLGAPDGDITQGLEVAFARWTEDPNDTDLQALATLFDSNHNGLLDRNDPWWWSFGVWVDANQNGVCNFGEMHTLDEVGIASISLAADHSVGLLPDTSRIHGFGQFTRTNGTTGIFADATLSYDPVGMKSIGNALHTSLLSEDLTAKGMYDATLNPRDANREDWNLDTDGLIAGPVNNHIHTTFNTPHTIYGGAGDDLIEMAAGDDIIDGGSGADRIFAGGGNDTIYFDLSDTVIDGGSGYDTGIVTSTGTVNMDLGSHALEAVISNSGNDTISANSSWAVYIDGRGGQDTLTGSVFGDILVGGAGNDNLSGLDGVDLLNGGDDADTLRGGPGNDVLIGGTGTDTAVFAGARSAYVLTDMGNNRVQVSGPDGIDTLSEIEWLQFDDQLLPWPPIIDLSASLSLSGTTASWSVRNTGTAALSVSFGGVYLSPDPTVTTADINLTTTVIAPLNGGAADARTLSLAFPTNLAAGTYYLAAIADTGPHFAESDELNNVSAVIAIMLGNAAANTLLGTPGPDTLFALDGNDLLNGGPGVDLLAGGPGADKFQFGPGGLADAQYGVGSDRIADYNRAEGDQVELSYILNPATVDSQPVASLVRAIASGTSTRLQVDTDGDANGHNWTTIAFLDGIRVGDSVNVILSGSVPAGVTIPVTAAPTESFDGDGHADILWQNANGTTAVWLMNGVNVSSMGAPLNPSAGWHARGSADFNGDGKADILWQHDNGTPAVWLMSGTGLVGSGPPLPNPGPAWHTKAAGDFDGDGKADILWQNDNGTPAVWLMNGVSLGATSAPLANPGPGWSAKAAADFNGDGKADILWQNENSGQPAVWLMDGMTVKSMGAAQPNFIPQWRVKDAADFNGDGKADILWQNDDGTPSIWLMNGTNLAQVAPQMPNPGAAWHAKNAADYDGDGRSDILWQNDNGTAAVWLMNGLSVWSYGPALPNPGADWHVI
jgi:Ca2+-binding RTX toxin-like protein